MEFEITIRLTLDEEQLAAMACVANRGPTNKKVTEEMAMSFWAQFIASSIEDGKRMNLAYAGTDDTNRAAIDANIKGWAGR